MPAALRVLTWLAVPLLLSGGTAVAAQESPSGAHELHANHVSVSLGGMTPLSETDETALALGLEYERRFCARWGLQGRVDHAFGDHKRSDLAQLAAVYHVGDFKLQTGPGFEVVEKEKSPGKTSHKAYFVWTVGAGYDFHVGSWSLTPLVVVDFVGETKTNLTYAIAVGTGF